MDEKAVWTEINKIIKKCERRQKRIAKQSAQVSLPTDSENAASNAYQCKYDSFMLAVKDIMCRDHEVHMDVTLRGDMARAFHITMAIGRYLWNKDEDMMVQYVMQLGIEQVINEYNSEVVLKEAKRVFKPMLKEILKELEDEEIWGWADGPHRKNDIFWPRPTLFDPCLGRSKNEASQGFLAR